MAWCNLGMAYGKEGKRAEALTFSITCVNLILQWPTRWPVFCRPNESDSVNSMKRKIRILIGNSQEAISDVILDTIAVSGFELAAARTEQAEQVLSTPNPRARSVYPHPEQPVLLARMSPS